jgi:hypothetical protein
MLAVKSKAFWIAFPLAVTAVSILGVSRLRQQARLTTPPAAVTENESAPAGAETITPNPPPSQITIPAKTEIEVRLNQSIASNRMASGDPFSATVATPVVVSGQTVIPEGAPVKGKVISVHEAGRLKGVAEIRLALDSVQVEGSYYDLHSSTFTRFGHNHKKRNWEIIGGGSGGGALLGALVGGGKGALIGGPIGAGAGIAGAAFTGKKDVVIPAETAMTFQLLQPVEVHL